MNANELRIGNKIFHRNKAITVNWQELKWIQEENNNFQPIPLTEEILLKLGFKHSGNGFFIHLKSLLELSNIGNEYFLSGFKGVSLNQIHHVHQLQNFYFALINEELTINL
jgi:hypothetical protein